MTIAVLGGGASGMAAALAAAKTPGVQVVVLERQSRLGRKLAATGNGRCNLTNLDMGIDRYHGDVAFAWRALQTWHPEKILAWFRSMGLLTVAEPGGRVYPLSDQAASVVDVLRLSLESAGAEVRCGVHVETLRREKGGFRITWQDGSLFADRVIVACGGAAGAKLGGGKWGYEFLEKLGHKTTALQPSLVQLKTEGELGKSLKGIRADALVTVQKKDTVLAQSEGEVQFTEYGLSGPAIFEVSRFAKPGTVVNLDLFRAYSHGALFELLSRRVAVMPEKTVAELFCGMLHGRLGRAVAKQAGFGESMPLSKLTKQNLHALAAFSKNFPFAVTGNLGFDAAQVTAGGVVTRDFDPGTLESRIVPGLFACGEVLDLDGDCGGYNLQWAWASGLAAGKGAVRGC